MKFGKVVRTSLLIPLIAPTGRLRCRSSAAFILTGRFLFGQPLVVAALR